jgi:hypothetical protein
MTRDTTPTTGTVWTMYSQTTGFTAVWRFLMVWWQPAEGIQTFRFPWFKGLSWYGSLKWCDDNPQGLTNLGRFLMYLRHSVWHVFILYIVINTSGYGCNACVGQSWQWHVCAPTVRTASSSLSVCLQSRLVWVCVIVCSIHMWHCPACLCAHGIVCLCRHKQRGIMRCLCMAMGVCIVPVCACMALSAEEQVGANAVHACMGLSWQQHVLSACVCVHSIDDTSVACVCACVCDVE